MWNDVGEWAEFLFGGDAPVHPLSVSQVAARAFVMFLAGVMIVRLGKSRLLSRATGLDVVLAVVVGSLISRGINGDASVSGTVVACAVLVSLHWIMTRLAFHWHGLGNLIKGRYSLLIENGRIDWDAMRRSHISEQDLLEELRLNAGVDDPSCIEKAYQERSGEISGLRRKSNMHVLEVAVEHGVQTVRFEMQRD